VPEASAADAHLEAIGGAPYVPANEMMSYDMLPLFGVNRREPAAHREDPKR
jgi:hypothetical protein